MKPRPDLNVGRWLAREEDDDEGGPKRILWTRQGRSPGDEVQATWAGVLVCADCVYLDEVEPVFAEAKRMQDLLHTKAIAMGCVAEKTISYLAESGAWPLAEERESGDGD